ncbi:MAG: hypothetical protein E7655_03320 [Ruminococcaceae bacterium]|nr:hypothetical protein [Oscillospiraceae bacterium]
MKNMTRIFLCIALVLLTASLIALSGSVSAADNVIFISDTGTGDGSSPSSPMGHGEGYTDPVSDPSKFSSNLYVKSAVNRAIDKLKDTGGTIVVCAPVTLRWGYANDTSVSEMRIGPADSYTTKTITFTSVYNGVDYRTENDAALIIKRINKSRLSPSMWCRSIWENIILRADHESASCVTEINYTFHCNTYLTQFKDTFTTEAYVAGVKVDGSDPANAKYFPLLAAAHRFHNLESDANVTVNGGIWQYVCGGTVGFKRYEQNDDYGLLTGNSTVTFGGNAVTLLGLGGGSYQTGGRVDGNVSVTINGGTIRGDIDLGGRGGFENENCTASLTITDGDFTYTKAINDISGAVGWYAPKTSTVDLSGMKAKDGLSADERAEAICALITCVDSIKMPDGSIRTYEVADDSLPEDVIDRLRSTPYTRDEYKAVYDSILAGERLNGKKHTVIDLLKMLSAPQTNAVEGFDVPANTDVMREKTIEYFDKMSQVEWVAPSKLDYTDATAFTTGLIYESGKTYTGMPYSSSRKPSASITEFLPYLNASKVYTGPTDFEYLMGVDCGAPRLAWAYGGALCNSGIHSEDFQLMVNYDPATKDVIATVGEYNTSKYINENSILYNSTYDAICVPNGPDVMYEAYAQVRPCDFVGSRFFIGNMSSTSQHIRMAVEDAVVFRNSNGVISGSKSYLTLSEQTSTIYDIEGKSTTWLLNQKYTFVSLYQNGYIPMTTKTLKSGVVEAPTMTFDKGSYAEGIDLVGRGTVKSNYTIFAINATVTDASGKVVKEAVVYPYSLSHKLTSTVSTTPPKGTAADTSRDQGMSKLNSAVRALPSGTYTYELKATIGFGEKTVSQFTFTK